jgi:hypothetical protein
VKRLCRRLKCRTAPFPEDARVLADAETSEEWRHLSATVVWGYSKPVAAVLGKLGAEKLCECYCRSMKYGAGRDAEVKKVCHYWSPTS